jgi:hypothetical protein
MDCIDKDFATRSANLAPSELAAQGSQIDTEDAASAAPGPRSGKGKEKEKEKTPTVYHPAIRAALVLGIRSGFYPWVQWGSLNAVHSVLGMRETRKGLYPSSTRLNCISVKGNNKG